MNHFVSRIHDDCDGNLEQQLVVARSKDRDMWIYVHDGITLPKTLRFRNFAGGGASPNTYQALVSLMKAIEKDNRINPLPNPPAVPNPNPSVEELKEEIHKKNLVLKALWNSLQAGDSEAHRRILQGTFRPEELFPDELNLLESEIQSWI